MLSFRFGSIPVRLHPTFFITTVFLGFASGDTDLRVILAWLVIVLASVFIHELGHAFAGMGFGLKPQIDMHGFGGTTSWQPGARVGWGGRILISLAGPSMGFVVGAVVFGLGLAGVIPDNEMGRYVFGSLLWVNVGWGVFNLLPMLPLDGGNVMLSGLNWMTDGRGERPARIVSLGVALLAAAGVAVLLLRNHNGGLGAIWPALLAAQFIANNWRGLQDLKAREHDDPMRPMLQQAYAALEAQDGTRVLSLARPIALAARTRNMKAEALQLVAFGFLLENRVADADAALAALPRGFAPHPSLLQLRANKAGAASI
jgi:Zn-dependent protease